VRESWTLEGGGKKQKKKNEPVDGIVLWFEFRSGKGGNNFDSAHEKKWGSVKTYKKRREYTRFPGLRDLIRNGSASIGKEEKGRFLLEGKKLHAK